MVLPDVTMSVTKMLSRIVAPKEIVGNKEKTDLVDEDVSKHVMLHDHTFGG